jgi:hypothetical protein
LRSAQEALNLAKLTESEGIVASLEAEKQGLMDSIARLSQEHSSRLESQIQQHASAIQHLSQEHSIQLEAQTKQHAGAIQIHMSEVYF